MGRTQTDPFVDRTPAEDYDVLNAPPDTSDSRTWKNDEWMTHFVIYNITLLYYEND